MPLSTSEISIGSQPTIEAEMEALREHVNDYRAALNQEGVWLFLTTLGCWGVTNVIFQFFAFLLAIVLFGHRSMNRMKETRTFGKLVKAIEERITQSLPEGDTRKARLYDLVEYQRVELSALSSFKNTKTFLFCWAFYGASFVYLILCLGVRKVG